VFQKRHYEAVADALQEARRFCRYSVDECQQAAILRGVRLVEDELMRTFRRDKARFSPDRFEKASGRCS
jgi:hypothetical protein